MPRPRARSLAAAAVALAVLIPALQRLSTPPPPPRGALALPAPGALVESPAPVPRVAPSATRQPPAASPSQTTPSPTSRASPSADDARRVLLEVLDRRAAGFADPAVADPDEWADATCACADLDRRALLDLAQGGLRLRGGARMLERVRVQSATADRLHLDVTDRLAAQETVDQRGAVTRRWPARGSERRLVELARAGGLWRLRSVASPSGGVDAERDG